MIYSPAEVLYDEDGNPIGVDGNPIKIDPTGTTTQPVSATALPLPDGAATAVKQPALGTAGSPSSDVITVQGDASGTPIPISGTVTLATGSLEIGAVDQGTGGSSAWLVDGSAVTQPVSATALPLPSGASTAAKQPALGTAGSPSSDVITVQGSASMTALKVDGSGVTQPVSGSVSVSNFPATQPVSATALPLPAGAATSANQTTLGSQTTKINDGTNTAAVKAASTAAIATDPALVVAISPNNPVAVSSSVIKASTAALSSVAAATSSTTLLTANSNRLNVIIINDGTNNLYMKFGTGASTTSFTYYITGHGTFEMQIPVVYTGIITGIWSTAVGNARITELTA